VAGKTDPCAARLAQYEKEGIDRAKFAITDIDGVLRGKYLTMEKFASALKSGTAFCDCTFGWDVNDQLYDNTTFTGWHTGYPDALVRLDLSTERRLADECNIPFFLGELVPGEGEEYHPVCPRNVLRRVVAKAAAMGLRLKLGFEYEFFIFEETPHSIREKGYKNLTPLTPGNFGYSFLRNSTYSDLFNEFIDYFSALDVPIEMVHCETGPGVWEATVIYDDALTAADKAVIFKTFAKVFFQKHGLMATFMAKWDLRYAGQSGHLHQSFVDVETGENLCHDPKRRGNMTELMERFVAGQVKYMKPFLAMSAPTVNSYTRLVKGAWAPTAATWGIDNRTAALRVIPGSEKSQRAEFRVAAADGNPYLVAASAIGAGLLGIEQNLELPEETRGNAYEVQDGLPDEFQFPPNLRDSARNLAASTEARELFGDPFVDHFVATREWEARASERAITDWQLERYFEII
jgi:glutamine synthetase